MPNLLDDRIAQRAFGWVGPIASLISQTAYAKRHGCVSRPEASGGQMHQPFRVEILDPAWILLPCPAGKGDCRSDDACLACVGG